MDNIERTELGGDIVDLDVNDFETVNLEEETSYLVINGAMLDDKSTFSYNYLRTLCKELGLPTHGKRAELEERLTTFRKDQSRPYSKFHNVPCAPPKASAMMSPLCVKPRRTERGELVGILSPSGGKPGQKTKKIVFSALNGVQVIPDRQTMAQMEAAASPVAPVDLFGDENAAPTAAYEPLGKDTDEQLLAQCTAGIAALGPFFDAACEVAQADDHYDDGEVSFHSSHAETEAADHDQAQQGAKPARVAFSPVVHPAPFNRYV